jgi:hypothetical protein
LPEYEAAARSLGDPWFTANAEVHRARGQLDADKPADAEATLLAALSSCERQGLGSRCVELDALLSRAYLAERKLEEARDQVRRGLNQARGLGDAQLETRFIQLLGAIARLQNASALERACVEEVGLRRSAWDAHAALPGGL